jgi:LPXTG-motif cell wall-anchored protein
MERIRMKKRFWQLAAAGVVAVGALAPATAAFATNDYPVGGHTGAVSSDSGVISSDPQVAAKTEVKGQLPFTGGDVAALAAIGGGAVAIGGLLVVQTRKRRVVQTS